MSEFVDSFELEAPDLNLRALATLFQFTGRPIEEGAIARSQRLLFHVGVEVDKGVEVGVDGAHGEIEWKGEKGSSARWGRCEWFSRSIE